MSPWVLVFLLAVTATWLGWRLHGQNRIARGLAESLERGHAYLRDHTRGWHGNRHWIGLMQSVNRLIEEKKLLETDRAGQVGRMKATLANMQEAVLVVDDDGHVLLANEAFRDLFPGRVCGGGEDIEQVFQNSALIEHLRAVREGATPGRREIEFMGGGGEIWVEVSGSRVPSFGGEMEEATLLVLHDITRLRRLESVRREFVANVSHELRTPLSLIKGYVETLNDGGEDVPEEDRRRFLQIIDKHTTRLERLVEDLLALSRLESGNPRLRKEEIVLETLLEEIVDAHRAGEEAARTFVLDLEPEPVPVQADALRIAQVLGNLLENAVKYSGQEVTIEAGSRREGDGVKVWVKDNGVGIAAEDLPHIFERFYRVDKGRSRESGGTGLGLSIVKHIVQLHGGQVWAESRPGEGTCICFTLPLVDRHAEVVEPA